MTLKIFGWNGGGHGAPMFVHSIYLDFRHGRRQAWARRYLPLPGKEKKCPAKVSDDGRNGEDEILQNYSTMPDIFMF